MRKAEFMKNPSSQCIENNQFFYFNNLEIKKLIILKETHFIFPDLEC